MAEATKKMTVNFDANAGALTFAWPDSGLEPVSFVPTAFPDVVRHFWLIFGAKTTGRNATIDSSEKGTVGDPAGMRARLVAKLAQWEAGNVSALRDSGARSGVPLIVLEAAVIYKRIKAAVKAGKGPTAWADAEFDQWTVDGIRAEVEALDDDVTNPEAVEAARAAAVAKGEDGDEAAAKAAITKLDQLVATTYFKLAMTAAKKAREERKAAALLAKAAAEDAAM